MDSQKLEKDSNFQKDSFRILDFISQVENIIYQLKLFTANCE